MCPSTHNSRLVIIINPPKRGMPQSKLWLISSVSPEDSTRPSELCVPSGTLIQRHLVGNPKRGLISAELVWVRTKSRGLSPPGTAEGSCNSIFWVGLSELAVIPGSSFLPSSSPYLGTWDLSEPTAEAIYELLGCSEDKKNPDHHNCYFLRAYYASGDMFSTFHEWSHLVLPLSTKGKSYSIILHPPCKETEVGSLPSIDS